MRRSLAFTPGLSFWRAMGMTQATTAVANTIPAGVGAAIGIGLTYTMLGSWGYSRSRTTTAILVSGVWNSFIKLGLPVLALALVALQGGATGGRVIVALLGIAGLAAAVVIFALMLRSEEVARRFGLLAGRVASRLLRLLRRPPVAGWELATVKFRTRTVGLVQRRWVAITVSRRHSVCRPAALGGCPRPVAVMESRHQDGAWGGSGPAGHGVPVEGRAEHPHLHPPGGRPAW
jgi:putative heme transporter